MLSERMQAALNDQFNAEMYSAHLYLAMAGEFGALGLDGFKHWMLCQANEEMDHALKCFEYILQRHGRVEMRPVEAPGAEWSSPMEAFEHAYEHEQYITGRIHTLVDAAMEEKDYATKHWLGWYVGEQVEEEAQVYHILAKLKLAGESGNGLMIIDKDLKRRPYYEPGKAYGESHRAKYPEGY